MKDLCALIVLVYYDRPNMVRNALRSIKDLQYKNWELVFIDDGSEISGQNIVQEVLKDYLDRITFYNTEDTIEDKIKQRGSYHGKFMNLAIRNSKADFVVILCDDDALTSWSLSELNRFFMMHPESMYCYSHIIPFDPFFQRPGPHLGRPKHWLNRYTKPIKPSCQVDSSQIVYRTVCVQEHGLSYKTPMTGALDADMFTQLEERYGLCPFTGSIIQYKGDFPDQMGKRSPELMFKPKDIVLL